MFTPCAIKRVEQRSPSNEKARRASTRKTLIVKKSLNRALNAFLFAVMGSAVGTIVGFVAGASVAAILLGYDWLHAALNGSKNFETLSSLCLVSMFGGVVGVMPGGVAGLCGALAFAFFRMRVVIVVYAVVAAAMTISLFHFGFHDAALYLVLVFACGGGFVFGDVLQRLWRSVKAQEERFAAQLEKRD